MKKLKHKRFPGQLSVVNQRINGRGIKTSLLRSESNYSSCESEYGEVSGFLASQTRCVL